MELVIERVPGRYAICRLPPDAEVPSWATGVFTSITRTSAELSIVCDESHVPPGVRSVGKWSALAVRGPIPFETTGVAAALTMPLAEAGISVFLVSTFDTDYLLIREQDVERGVLALCASGHSVR